MTQRRLYRSLYFQVLVAIALSLAARFIAQATDTPLGFGDQMLLTATVVVARWEGAVDLGQLKAAFAGAGGEFGESESDALQIEGRSDVV